MDKNDILKRLGWMLIYFCFTQIALVIGKIYGTKETIPIIFSIIFILGLLMILYSEDDNYI